MKPNRLVLLAGLCGLVAGAVLTAVVLSTEAVRAQEKTEGRQVCDLTYIQDPSWPDIGQKGQIKYTDEWKVVVEAGWKLKTATTGIYIFERCR